MEALALAFIAYVSNIYAELHNSRAVCEILWRESKMEYSIHGVHLLRHWTEYMSVSRGVVPLRSEWSSLWKSIQNITCRSGNIRDFFSSISLICVILILLGSLIGGTVWFRRLKWCKRMGKKLPNCNLTKQEIADILYKNSFKKMLLCNDR